MAQSYFYLFLLDPKLAEDSQQAADFHTRMQDRRQDISEYRIHSDHIILRSEDDRQQSEIEALMDHALPHRKNRALAHIKAGPEQGFQILIANIESTAAAQRGIASVTKFNLYLHRQPSNHSEADKDSSVHDIVDLDLMRRQRVIKNAQNGMTSTSFFLR